MKHGLQNWFLTFPTPPAMDRPELPLPMQCWAGQPGKAELQGFPQSEAGELPQSPASP